MKITGSQTKRSWTKAERAAAANARWLFLRSDAKESAPIYVDSANATITFVRTPRGVYRVHRGPNGEDFGQVKVA